MMNQETIHIRKLTTGYPGKGGTKIVAKDIDATIRSGELTCLLGANGVGTVSYTHLTLPTNREV